jgi:exodeoxyribonuclease-3
VLPGDPEDLHSRYIEATIGSGASAVIVGCLYLPNGNPAPGPKFDFKLRWLDRFLLHAAELVGGGTPVVLAGDYNIIPTEIDVYVNGGLTRLPVESAYARLLARGWTDALRFTRPGRYTF